MLSKHREAKEPLTDFVKLNKNDPRNLVKKLLTEFTNPSSRVAFALDKLSEAEKKSLLASPYFPNVLTFYYSSPTDCHSNPGYEKVLQKEAKDYPSLWHAIHVKLAVIKKEKMKYWSLLRQSRTHVNLSNCFLETFHTENCEYDLRGVNVTNARIRGVGKFNLDDVNNVSYLRESDFLYSPSGFYFYMQHYHLKKLPDYIAQIIIDTLTQLESIRPKLVDPKDFILSRDLKELVWNDFAISAVCDALRSFAVKQQQTYEKRAVVSSFAAIKALYYFEHLHEAPKPSSFFLEESEVYNANLELNSNDFSLPRHYLHNDQISEAISAQCQWKINQASGKDKLNVMVNELLKRWGQANDRNFYSVDEIHRRFSGVKKYWETEGKQIAEIKNNQDNGFFIAVADQLKRLPTHPLKDHKELEPAGKLVETRIGQALIRMLNVPGQKEEMLNDRTEVSHSCAKSFFPHDKCMHQVPTQTILLNFTLNNMMDAIHWAFAVNVKVEHTSGHHSSSILGVTDQITLFYDGEYYRSMYELPKPTLKEKSESKSSHSPGLFKKEENVSTHVIPAKAGMTVPIFTMSHE